MTARLVSTALGSSQFKSGSLTNHCLGHDLFLSCRCSVCMVVGSDTVLRTNRQRQAHVKKKNDTQKLIIVLELCRSMVGTWRIQHEGGTYLFELAATICHNRERKD